MKDRRKGVLVSGLVVAGLAALTVLLARGGEPHGLVAPSPDPHAGLDAPGTGALLPPAIPGQGIRDRVERAIPPTPSKSLPGNSSATDALELLLAQLREIAAVHGFHDQAWPILGAVADLAASREIGVIKRLEGVVKGAESDVDRVRGGCLVALAMGGASEARALAKELIAGTPELERAAWISLGLTAEGGQGLRIDLARFEGPGDLETFPATIAKEASASTVRLAIARLQSSPPAELMEVSTDADGNRPRLEEQFTRSIIVLSILGPSVGHEGPERETLLRWLRGAGAQAWLADEAVLHCLALACKEDPALAAELLGLASAHLFEPEGTGILEALVRLGAQQDLVLDHLRGFFASERAISGDSLYALTQVQAIAALMPLLSSDDSGLRDEASRLVLDRLQAPDMDSTERLLFLSTLAERRPELVLDAVSSLAARGASEEQIADSIIFLDSLPSEQRQAGQQLLASILAQGGLGSSTRMAILKEIWQLGAIGAQELLESLRAVEVDPTVIAFLDNLRK